MKKMLLISAVLVVFCLLAITPTNSFATTKTLKPYEVESLRLYEAGHNKLSRDQRDYQDSFPKTTTRYIYAELNLRNIMFGMLDQSHKLLIQFWNPDETLHTELKKDITIKSESFTYHFWARWGWKQPGKWLVGTYMVKFWMMDDGRFLGARSFTIYNDTGTLQDPFEIGRRMALTGRSVYQGKTWVKDNWTGNSTHSFHILYDVKRNWVVFAERSKDRSKNQIMWVKKYNSNTYVKMIGKVGGNEFESAVPLSQFRAEKEAWRILKYFDR